MCEVHFTHANLILSSERAVKLGYSEFQCYVTAMLADLDMQNLIL